MKMLKTTVIATALLASSPLIFANTNVSANASAEVNANGGGLLSNIGQGIHNTADKVGNGIEKGVDKTREVSKDAWDGTKILPLKSVMVSKKVSIRPVMCQKMLGMATKNVAGKVGTGVEKVSTKLVKSLKMLGMALKILLIKSVQVLKLESIKVK